MVDLLARAGFLAATENADELIARAGDDAALDPLVQRRLSGEPLAWIVGATTFCGLRIIVHPGVYVPRWHSERLVRRAVQSLPRTGVAVDVCTGSGAAAVVMRAARPHARVVATELDATAVECATANGVDVYQGDALDPVSADVRGHVDVIVAIVPYVPTAALALLQRDTLTFESARSYDGGTDGTIVLRRVADEARAVLRPGGVLLLEVGGTQAGDVAEHLRRLGYVDVQVHVDDDGDPRSIEARLTRRTRTAIGR